MTATQAEMSGEAAGERSCAAAAVVTSGVAAAGMSGAAVVGAAVARRRHSGSGGMMTVGGRAAAAAGAGGLTHLITPTLGPSAGAGAAGPLRLVLPMPGLPAGAAARPHHHRRRATAAAGVVTTVAGAATCSPLRLTSCPAMLACTSSSAVGVAGISLGGGGSREAQRTRRRATMFLMILQPLQRWVRLVLACWLCPAAACLLVRPVSRLHPALCICLWLPRHCSNLSLPPLLPSLRPCRYFHDGGVVTHKQDCVFLMPPPVAAAPGLEPTPLPVSLASALPSNFPVARSFRGIGIGAQAGLSTPHATTYSCSPQF